MLPEGALAVTFGPRFELEPKSRKEERRLRCEYSGFLHAMGESSLWPVAPSTEVYRFTWIRSFDNPVVIRVERRGAVYQVQAKQMDSGSIDTGPLDASRSRLLSPSEWAELQRRLAALDFWSQGARVTREHDVVYLDGSDWLLEGARDGRYRLFSVFSPEKEGAAGAFRNVCLYLLELSGLSVPEDAVY